MIKRVVPECLHIVPVRKFTSGCSSLLLFAFLFLNACQTQAQPPADMQGDVQETAAPSWPQYPLTDSAALSFEKDIRAYEVLDSLSGHQQVDVIVTGSSSIVRWRTLETDLAPLPVRARGFGGSTLEHCSYYAHRILFPLRPKLIVIYAGENDIAYADGPDTLAFNSFRAFVQHVHAALPATHIMFISMKPSPARAKYWAREQSGNALISAWTQTDPRLSYVDVTAPMLDAQGKPRPEIFSRDKLHMNEQGYAIWQPLIRDAIENELKKIRKQNP